MGREEIDVAELNRGDKCWHRNQEWEVASEGQRYIHLVNNSGHDYLAAGDIVEVE